MWKHYRADGIYGNFFLSCSKTVSPLIYIHILSFFSVCPDCPPSFFSFFFRFFVFSLRWSGTVLLSLSRIVLSLEKLISAASNTVKAPCVCVCMCVGFFFLYQIRRFCWSVLFTLRKHSLTSLPVFFFFFFLNVMLTPAAGGAIKISSASTPVLSARASIGDVMKN